MTTKRRRASIEQVSKKLDDALVHHDQHDVDLKAILGSLESLHAKLDTEIMWAKRAALRPRGPRSTPNED